ncbi:MAG: heme-binding protein, partial [Adhaeribacter sp.]
MKKPSTTMFRNKKLFWAAALVPALLLTAFQDDKGKGLRRLVPEEAARMAKAIEAVVSPELAAGLTLNIWGVDSLISDPVAIHVDEQGRLFYNRTNRQKNSEFDIRGHQDWEIESTRIQTVEDKREFLRRVLSPENSAKNNWLKDLNGDGSHDWRDMTVE